MFGFLLTMFDVATRIRRESYFSYNLGDWPESFYEITVNDLATKKATSVRVLVAIFYCAVALDRLTPFSCVQDHERSWFFCVSYHKFRRNN